MSQGNNGATYDASLPPTEMLYMTYEGNWLMNCESTVLAVESNTDSSDNAAVSIVLDRSVLHAQGGGQPTDTGKLVVVDDVQSDNDADGGAVVAMHVSKVLVDRATGIARHTGTVTAGAGENDKQARRLPKVGDSVRVVVDEAKRRILSECHTAGHVFDSAMARCGKMMKPSKAYHFLEGPYVEYVGEISENERSTVLSDLQAAFCQLVKENIDTEIALMSKEEADVLCNRQAQNFDMDVFADPLTQQIRVVTVASFPCPCGGTHVRSTGDLEANLWGITGIKSKKGVVRVKYGQDVKV